VAKPVIDVGLVVPDSSDERAFPPALLGGRVRAPAREPEWKQHRFLVGVDPTSNVHVFSRGARESQRH